MSIAEPPIIRAFIDDRLHTIQEKLLLVDGEYWELNAKIIETWHRLAAELTPEGRKLLNEYEEQATQQTIREDEVVYRRGLLDGILLTGWIERMKNAGDEKISE